MKTVAAVVGALCSFAQVTHAADKNPLGTVMSLLDELRAKIVKEGEIEVKAFKEYFDWCDDTAKNGEQSIKTATAQKAKLEAK
eukprot:CAMPEP_0170259974 /NCGR_PEP_ID=MMETSP0116_2-20130129/29859_1 /TAXON_ID=400756 /ORGANISM="Durinskia baltica, Strain CSIRO CS-38" /LENGTH=82 /DNA_ID=CAMNT_0010511021 /DNA_START=86 /DNA_END=331 /DNA_ORIENTATION=+